MTRDPGDERWMDEALGLGRSAWGRTSPNPMVGAVVVANGVAVGRGAHLRAGEAHAERLALEAAAREVGSGGSGDWTLYLNLEPCVHHGRTPPCIDAVLASPVRRVVVAMSDPDPRVGGQGIARLRDAGVRVEVGCREAEARELNHAFVARQMRRRAFVAHKVALSADGCIAGPGGGPTAITGDAARAHAHAVRAGLDAILVGRRTLEADRPRLDTRLYDGPGGSTPRRLVLDPELRTAREALWAASPLPVLFCREQAASRAGRYVGSAEVCPLPEGPQGLDLEALVARLPDLGVWSLLVEGGGASHLRFLEWGLWDRFYVYRNPRLKLDGVPWVAGDAWERSRPQEPVWSLDLGSDRVEVFAASVLGHG